MWLLSHIGEAEDVLQGRRLWLRPGSAHHFGRTSSKPTTGERCVYISASSVSRKHVIFRVAAPSAGSSTRLHERTNVTICDESKKGTIIDGERLVQGEKIVDGSKGSYRVQLGDTGYVFKLEWQDVVVSFTNISRTAKRNGTVLAEEKQKLDGCDIKLASEYLTNKTTHTVAKKRNTPAALQALVQGKWLVTSSWVDALAEVVKRKSQDETSPLEDDFDGKWPKEVDYIVPASGEPNPRPNEYLRPDPERAEVFADYTFIFLSQTQYESILPIISGGGGKAVHMDFQVGQTTVDDVVDFAKTLSGNKNDRQFLLSQEPGPGGIVVVRISDKDDDREAVVLLMDELSITLNQRTIEQSELLDAILTKDASGFRRPLRAITQSVRQQETPAASSSFPRAPNGVQAQARNSPAVESERAPPSAQGTRQTQQEEQQQQAEQPPTEEAPPTRRRNRRMITQPRKIDFDDFDPSQFAAPESSVNEPAASMQEPTQAASVQAMDVDEPVATSNTQQASHKRPAEEDLVKEEEIDEKMFPGMAAMKRRKTEALKRGKRSHQPTPEPDVSVVDSKPAKGKKKESEADIKTKIKKYREQEEENRRKEEGDEDEITADLENMKVDHVIETFDPPVSNSTQAEKTTSQNPAWNGRPNYKNFRSNKRPRNGQEWERPDSQRVLISLEEIPSKSQGMGDEYWLETGQNNERRKGKGSKSQSKSQSQQRTSQTATASRQSGAAGFGSGDSDEDDATAFRRRLERSREEDRDQEIITAEFDPNAPSQTQGKVQKKRGALDSLFAPAAKKPRTAASKAAVPRGRVAAAIDLSEEEDEDEDPTTFRRKRR